MSVANFRVTSHTLPASHIREYRHSTRSRDSTLQIAIKQYTPLSSIEPLPGSVTIIAAHANGVPKELYEILWDELLARTRGTSVAIRSIWIADVTFQGASSVLNERSLGNDPSWYDHPRDLFLLINHFREQMPEPLIGVGHSMGGNNIVNLSLMHPRLFTGVILIDPVIQARSTIGNSNPAIASTYRRDIWPSREAAATSFRANKFYQSWDPRVFDLWIEFGLRDLPTELYPAPPEFKNGSSGASGASKPVTLTTTKSQEVFTFLRSKHPARGQSMDKWQLSRDTHPDVHEDNLKDPFYCAAAIATFAQLPHLRPKCFYIFAGNSELSTLPLREDKLRVTGTGLGGSGGATEGAVSEVLIDAAGHFVPFERPNQIAKLMFGWLEPTIKAWRQQEDEAEKAWAQISERSKFTIDEDRLWWVEQEKKAMKGSRL